ncbi:probable protein S-acyltransferase 14 isoform X2 [Cicer arietinum]|uniref:S-acyltransferase n=1 Tax=Cicer arietinum TaxID=3827 RepID=A0A1S2Z657_CICAR|nr:probable protein S-acyltransferase 14 isoform X2 [Cicer arietinum]
MEEKSVGGEGGGVVLKVLMFCTRLRNSMMIVFFLSLVSFTYYIVVVAIYGPSLLHGRIQSISAFIVLLIFHALLVMLLWSYFSVVFTDPGRVPLNWRPKICKNIGDDDSYDDQRIRYCRKCNQFKPPRCHHCSSCGRCILKMDHHCIWVVNCVGALNYKYFLLFLFYTLLETALVTVSLFPYVKAFFSDEDVFVSLTTLAVSFIAFAFNLVFVLSILGFLIMHVSLVATNTTTTEAIKTSTTPKWHYNLGWRKNYEQIFGNDKRYWLIPAYSEEDLRQMTALHGLEYPIDPDLEALQQS